MRRIAAIALSLTAVACATSAAPLDTLTDAKIRAIADAPFDKRAKMFKHEVLGLHHGANVVADYPCSDLCPDYTTRVIHYDVEPGPACDKIGGVKAARTIPMGIGAAQRDYCVPKVLAEAPRP